MLVLKEKHRLMEGTLSPSVGQPLLNGGFFKIYWGAGNWGNALVVKIAFCLGKELEFSFQNLHQVTQNRESDTLFCLLQATHICVHTYTHVYKHE